jgi:hypothetical protein
MLKRYRVTKSFLLAAVLLSSLFFSFQNSEAQDDFVANELIIKLKKTAIGLDVANDLARENVDIMEEIPELGVLVVRISSEGALKAKQDLLSNNPNFEYVEKNFIYRASINPNDQFFNFQTYLPVINAPTAWNTEQGSTNTVIAVP